MLVFLLSLYFIFLLYSLAPAPDMETSQVPKEIEGLSILIPFRDEANNLPQLLESLKAVNFSFPVQFLFINDHSQDESVSIVEKFEGARIISSDREGKKFAIQKGVESASYPWVLTLDADVKITPELSRALDVLDVRQGKMFLFSLSPTRRGRMVAAFFDLEFIALQAIGIGMAQKGNPILSNGACLLFLKDAFSKANTKRQDYHIPSGDDIFGMFAIAEVFGKEAVKVASVEPLVTVSFPEKLIELLSQRSRWISKTLDVPDVKYKFLAFLMGIIHLTPLFVLIALLLGLRWPDALAILFIKWLGEWIFFWIVSKNYQRRDLLLYLPLSQLLYPIYTFALIALGVYRKLQFKKSQLNAAG
ncbi:glycosyltransferase [Cryomorphaceae bacterium 1068]|nr:glycosyltransferase [Cryomorphaceae bacterium 1068]